MNTYSARLRAAIEQSDKSRKKLAAFIGVSVQEIGQVLNNDEKSLNAENSANAAAFLGSVKTLPFEASFFTKRGVKKDNAVFAYAKGDSMQPFIFDGDVFGMDITDTTPRDGEIYAVYFGGEAMLKQVFIEGDGSLTLHSFNPTWRDKQVHEHNGSDFKILGRQFWRAG